MIALKNSFRFTEEMFREYYLLHLKPHDDSVAPGRIRLFILLYVPASVFLVVVVYLGLFVSKFPIESMSTVLTIIWAFIVPAVTIIGLTHSIYLARGRKINWESPRWKARTELVFRHLKYKPTQTPIPKGIEYDFVPLYLLTAMASIGLKWHNDAIYFDIIPYLFPRFKPELTNPSYSCAPYEVDFSAQFFEDRIEKGKSGEVFAQSYADIFDVLDSEKFSNIAIIRHKDKKSELVLNKKAFGDVPWEAVRGYILEQKWKAEGGRIINPSDRYPARTGSYQ